MKKVIAISIALVILLILMFLSLDQVQMMLPHLLLGWMDFIQRNIHQMRVRREVIWSVLLYAAILVVGGHYFARWLLRHLNGGLWKWSWSLRGFVLFLLMFIAGTSAVAVVRQTEWLVHADRPMFSFRSCSSHLRQIGQGLLLYRLDHGKYPDDLAEVLLDTGLEPEVLCCPATADEPAEGKTREEMVENARKKGHCSYIYFCKGRVEVGDDDVMVSESLSNHRDGINAVFGDGHCEWIRRQDAEELLAKLATTRPTR